MKKKLHYRLPSWEAINKLLLIMKVSILLLLIGTFSVTASVSARAQKVSLKMENASIRQVFNEIEKQAGYKFFYIDEQVDVSRKVDIAMKDKSIEAILDQLVENTQLKYKVFENKLVVLSPKAAIQQIKITGKVVDAKTGESLPGVSVMIEGSTKGTVTDIDGKYSIDLPDSKAVLSFSYIGYDTEKASAEGKSKIDISLNPNVKALEEVVVVGYGTLKKSDVTGATTRVTAKDISQMPVQNAIQAMQGKAAGVDITSATYDRPGEMGTVTIRGNRSFNGTNAPLYVVDGIPLEAGGIDAFNPQDIESIDILKDASATAIYGSRGANGVILVTTKKGVAGKTSINFSSTLTFDKINDLCDNFNSAEYIDYRREAYRGRTVKDGTVNVVYDPSTPTIGTDKSIFLGTTDATAWANIAKAWASGTYDASKLKNTNWTDYVSRTGVTQNYTLSVSGGNDKTRSYLSAGFLDQKGVNKDQRYSRYTLQANIDCKPTKWFTVGASITGTWAKQLYGYLYQATGAKFLYDLAKAQLPYAAPYDSVGNFIYNPGGDINIVNPVNEAENAQNERTTLRAMGNVFAEIQFTDWLKYRINFGPDFRNYRLGQFQKGLSQLRGGLASSPSYARYAPEQHFAYTVENLLYFDKTFASIHKVGVTLLQSSSSNRTERSDIQAIGLNDDNQLWYGIEQNASSAPSGYSTSFSKNTLMSYMARVNYTLNDKYLLTASGRWDGSSMLAEGHQWDFFSSFALAWKLHEEPFMRNIKFITELKPRIGYGVTGNAGSEAYGTLGGLMLTYYRWGTTQTSGYLPTRPAESSPAKMPNKNLGWEKTKQLNFGIDFGIFSNRISGAIDYYIAKTSDVLLERAIPAALGYTVTWDNIGKTQNNGLEVRISSVNLNTSKFKWTTDISFSTNKEQVIETSIGKYDDINAKLFIGKPLGVYYDYVKQSIWQTADQALINRYNAKTGRTTYSPGTIRFKDLNNDSIIEANNDRTVIGQKTPKWTAGMLNTFTYKGWELSCFVYSRWGQTITGSTPDYQARFASRKFNYWTINNPTNDGPRPNYANTSYATTVLYEDGSFIKVKNISLGYTFPKEWMGKLHISNFKLYGMLVNPFLYTKNGYIDPDVGTSVSSKSYVLGLNVSF